MQERIDLKLKMLILAEQFRDLGITCSTDFTGSRKSQLKRAKKSKARFVVEVKHVND
jgi:histidyl-tRNA synthetase